MTACTRADTSDRDWPDGRRATFIVRVWRERDEDAGWRGVVEHVQTGERRAAASVDDLVEVLERWLRCSESKRSS